MKSLKVTRYNLAEVLEEYPAKTNAAILQAAIEYGCTVYLLSDLHLFRIEHNNRSAFFHDMQHSLNSQVSARLANDKYLTNTLLAHAGFPISSSIALTRAQFESGQYDVETLSFPVVVKPQRNTCSGEGVVLNITTREQLQRILREQFFHYNALLIEEFFQSKKEYRVMVLDNRVIAAIERLPANVIGDNIHTIEELITEKNSVRESAPHINLGKIPYNDELNQLLKTQGYILQDVPAKKKCIQLQYAANAARGGEFIDVTDDVSEENNQLCVQTLSTLGMRFGGIDIMCDDIRESIRTGGRIIEVNAAPGITCHIYPHQGQSRSVHKDIINALLSTSVGV